MKTLALLTIFAALASGCATSRNHDQDVGAAGPASEIYSGSEFGMPGSNSGTTPGTMGNLQRGNSSQDSPQAAVPSSRSYQPNRF
jgi:hypothetical protein